MCTSFSVGNNLIDSLKSFYNTSLVQAHSNDQKVQCKTVNKLLQKKTSRCYTSAPSNDVLANHFADFFHDKIFTIREDLQLCIFDAVTHGEVKAFASKSIPTSCSLVLLPSHIINGCFDTLLPIITSIVNLSLATGVIPESLKLAELLPSLKKPDADHEECASFRPTSNLPVVSKVVEKAAGP